MKSPLIAVLLAVTLLVWGVAGAWAEVLTAAHAEIVVEAGDRDEGCAEGAEGGAAHHGDLQHECCVAACSLSIALSQVENAPGLAASGQFQMVHDRAASQEESPLHRPPRFHVR